MVIKVPTYRDDERQSKKQNVIVGNSKTTVSGFSIFFAILERKNPTKSKMVNLKSLCVDMIQINTRKNH